MVSLPNRRRIGGYIDPLVEGLTSIGIEEPSEFSEPGLFIIGSDKTLYWSQISTMPFARPHFREIIGALKFAMEKEYPARGELS